MPNHTLSDRKEVTAPHKGFTAGLMFVAVLSLALNLRAAASSVGPLLAEIGEGMDFSGDVLGFLTSLPGLIFGLLGLAAVRIGKQFGITATLLLSAGANSFVICFLSCVCTSELLL